MNPDKNLVMGFATNQSEASVRIFCQSLRQVYSQGECDVTIVTNRHEPYFSQLARLGIRFESTPNNYSAATRRTSKLVNRVVLYAFLLLHQLGLGRLIPEIAAAYPVLIETWHHPQLARWFAYLRLLTVGRFYRQILLVDVKDVVFQAPFFPAAPEEAVVLFADANLYGNCYWNDKWYREAYSQRAFAQIAGQQPVCIGTVLGTQQAILEMLEEFTAVMARAPFGRVEQAIFNHMLHTGGLRARHVTAPNLTCAVATLASEAAHASVGIMRGTICRNSDQTPIPIVHMYDRWPDTAALCLERYAGSGSPQRPSRCDAPGS
jgi:hypothetical protein